MIRVWAFWFDPHRVTKPLIPLSSADQVKLPKKCVALEPTRWRHLDSPNLWSLSQDCVILTLGLWSLSEDCVILTLSLWSLSPDCVIWTHKAHDYSFLTLLGPVILCLCLPFSFPCLPSSSKDIFAFFLCVFAWQLRLICSFCSSLIASFQFYLGLLVGRWHTCFWLSESLIVSRLGVLTIEDNVYHCSLWQTCNRQSRLHERLFLLIFDVSKVRSL